MGIRFFLWGLLVALIAVGVWFATDRTTPGPSYSAPPYDTEVAEPSQGPLLKGVDPRPMPVATPTLVTPATPSEDDTRFSGRVVNVDKQPVANARVEVRLQGELLHVLSTDKQGKYAFRSSFPQAARTKFLSGLIVARGPDHTVGSTFFLVIGPLAMGLTKDRPINEIMLGPGADIRVSVASTCASNAPISIWVVSLRANMSDAIATAQMERPGEVVLENIPSGSWHVIAAAEGCGRASSAVVVKPSLEAKTQLTLPSSRTLIVVVRDKETDTPIANAHVTLLERVLIAERSIRYRSLISIPDEYTSNAAGVAEIESLGDQDWIRLHVQADGYPEGAHALGEGQGTLIVRPDQTEVLVELSRGRTIRWPIEDKGGGIPPDGSVVTIQKLGNSMFGMDVPSSGVIDGGELVAGAWGPGQIGALAYVEGLGAARLWAAKDKVVGHPTAFYPVRTIELFAKNADGSPATDAHLAARGPGNNLLKPVAKANSDGYAVLTNLYGGPMATANCSASRNGNAWGGSPLGTVDLAQGDGHFEFTMPTVRVLRVTFLVNGAPVPDGFQTTVMLGSKHTQLASTAGVCEVSFTPVKHKGTISLYLRMRGYRVEGPPPTLDLDAPDPLTLTVNLRATGSARVTIIAATDDRQDVAYETWDSASDSWASSGGPLMARAARPDSQGVVLFSDLLPGRYRAIDRLSGKTSEPFEVIAGGDPATAMIDLSQVGWAKGRVVAPDGVALAGFSVGHDDEPIRRGFAMHGYGRPLPGAHVNPKDGSFYYRVETGTPVTLRVFHTTCQPHPTKGRVTVNGPRDDVELHAIAGVKATVRLSEPLKVRMNRGQARNVDIRLFKDKVEGSGIRLSGTLNAAHDTIEFGSFKPGQYTVWIDVLFAAPLILENITLTDQDLDLGTHTTSPGSSLIVHVKTKDGQSPPRMHLSGTALSEPTYARNIDARGARVVFSGFGKGKFQLAGALYSGTGSINKVFEFDGRTDVEHTIDLR